jgi:hypothetical protein
MTGQQVDSRIEELWMRARLTDTLALYCRYVDDNDFARVATLFTEDCVTDFGPGRGGRIAGRTPFIERLAPLVASFRRTQHQLGQIVFDHAGDVWTSMSYCTAWHEDFAGEHFVSRVRYLDTFAPDGRIAERRVQAMGFEGWPDGAPVYEMVDRDRA